MSGNYAPWLIVIACIIPLPSFQEPDEKWGEVEWTTHIRETEQLFLKYDEKHRFWDRTRPDLIGELVIEVDWSSKWKEGVGQACYYKEIADKPGAVILLFPDGINSEKERLRGYRCMIACKGAGLKWFFYDCKNKKFIRHSQ